MGAVTINTQSVFPSVLRTRMSADPEIFAPRHPTSSGVPPGRPAAIRHLARFSLVGLFFYFLPVQQDPRFLYSQNQVKQRVGSRTEFTLAERRDFATLPPQLRNADEKWPGWRSGRQELQTLPARAC